VGKHAFKIVGFALTGLLPSLVFAAGLGRMTVLSALGQPLKGEIEIVSVQPGETEGLSASLAPQNAFRQANIEMNGALFDVRFAIERRPNGQYAVVLSSTRPINEPFLDMLVQLDWPSGRLLREYTFLLDPPEYTGPASASVAAPVTPPVAQPLPAEKPGSAESARQPAAAASSAGKPADTGAAPGTYEVKRGDTLGKIARQNAQQGVSLQQMLVALYRGNEDAFIGSNMNRLRAGRILNIPDRETALSVSIQEARRLVDTQGAAYAEYQRSVGAAVAAAPAPPEGSRQASGRITTGEEQKPAAPKEAPRDQLRLAKPDDVKAGGSAGQAAAADNAVAKDKALKEAQERVAALEKNVADLQKLLTLKNGAGAQVQQQAQETKGAPAAAKSEPPQAAPAQPAKPEAGKGPQPVEASKAGPPEAGKAPDVAKAKPAPKAPIKAPPPPQTSLLDDLVDNPYTLGGIGVAVLLLIGLGAYAWRRKKQAAGQRFDPSFMGPASLAPSNSALGAAGGQSVDTGTSSLQMDFSTGAQGKAQAEEIDPVAEADVYMAYGRDAQAEEILKEALAKDTTRTAVRLKLLEIYANRKDAKAFEAAARELHTSSGGQGPDWQKAAALGRQVDPSNTLYGGSAQTAPKETPAAPRTPPEAVAAAPAAAPPLDFDLDLGVPTVPTVPDINLDVAANATASEAVTIDFDLDLGSTQVAATEKEAEFSPDATVALTREKHEPEAAPLNTLDFDLGLGDQPAAPSPLVQPEAAAEPPQSAAGGPASIDFDFNLDAIIPGPASEPAAPIDLSSIKLDMAQEPGAPATATGDAKWQEVSTKIDLAKAYEEMGDKDGARDLLNEVMKEGDNAQQQQAKSLLAALT